MVERRLVNICSMESLKSRPRLDANQYKNNRCFFLLFCRYHPADAITHAPVTTLQGLLSKHIEANLDSKRAPSVMDTVDGGGAETQEGESDYDCPPRYRRHVSTYSETCEQSLIHHPHEVLLNMLNDVVCF